MDPGEASSHVLEDDGSEVVDADVNLTDASCENTSSRASSAHLSRPMTRGTNGTRPQSSGSIFVDDESSECGWGGSGGSELSASVKRLIGAAKDRSASSSSHNMEAIIELYEQTKISTAEAQKNPQCIIAPIVALDLNLRIYLHACLQSKLSPCTARKCCVFLPLQSRVSMRCKNCLCIMRRVRTYPLRERPASRRLRTFSRCPLHMFAAPGGVRCLIIQ
jgi:hypothetical protein